MKDLKAQRGRFYLQRLIQEGEHQQQDFKYAISDACKIARSISAFANHSGGHLLIGVKDNGTVAGVRNEEDIYVVEQAAQMYCQPPQDIDFKVFTYDAGINIIRASVAQSNERPVRARDTDGTWKAYIRVADENILAHQLMVRHWERMSNPLPSRAVPFDGMSARLLDMLHAEPMSVEQAMVRLHLSQAAIDELVLMLLSARLVDFKHTHHGWLLVPAHDEE